MHFQPNLRKVELCATLQFGADLAAMKALPRLVIGPGLLFLVPYRTSKRAVATSVTGAITESATLTGALPDTGLSQATQVCFHLVSALDVEEPLPCEIKRECWLDRQ